MSSLTASINSLNIVSNYDLVTSETNEIDSDSASITKEDININKILQINNLEIPIESIQSTGNKRVIKTLFRFIKNSKKNEKKNAISSSINNLNQNTIKEKSKKLNKLRPSKSIAFLNAISDSQLSSDESEATRIGKSRKTNRHSSIKLLSKKNFDTFKNRNNRKDRSFTLVNRSNILSHSFSTTSSLSNRSKSINDEFNKNNRYSITSKELTWYKLEELDDYYKILEHVMEETSANILNVIEIIQEKFIILTGGCTRNGSLLFTFTDNCNNKEIKVENYRKAIDYFCNIPSESDKQTGFSILIDRRNDKWSSVKNVLILIQDYFPAKLNTIFILRPQSYFQRVLSSILFQEDSLNESVNLNFNNQSIKNQQIQPFNIKICKSLEELYESIDKENLTTEFGGSIHYRHQEWIEQRQFIEKLSSNVNECVSNLKQFIKSMEETDFPNDVSSTQILIDTQLKERTDLLSTVQSTKRFGETVLNLIEKTSKIDMYENKTEKYSALTPDIRIHYQTVFNLLKLMEESQRTLEMFWNNHFIRLNKCLDLRKFEQKFKDVRINILQIYEKLSSINDENIELEQDYDNFISLLQVLNEQSKSAFEEAFNLYNQGIELLLSNKKNFKLNNLLVEESEKSNNIDSGVESSTNDLNSLKNLNLNCINLDTNNNNNKSEMVFAKQESCNTGYCVDSVEPKCSELKRLIDEFKSSYLKKLNNLKINKSLSQKLNLAKEVYEKGLRLLNDQELVNLNQDKSKRYLSEIDQWLKEYEKLDLYNTKLSNETSSEEDTTTLSSFDMEVNFENKTKQSVSVKNFEVVTSQLKSLSQMFDKRKEHLCKTPVIIKPVQRVEPQQFQNTVSKRDNSKNKIFDVDNFYENPKPKRTLSNAESFQTLGLLNKNFKKANRIQKPRKLSNGSSSSSMNENEEDEMEEQKKLNEKKIKHILNELIETERIYVSELKLIIDGYLNTLTDSENQNLIPSFVLINKDLLFSNIKEIYKFHNKIFLKELEERMDSIPKICKLFIDCKQNFYLYSTYCLNKPNSEEIWREYCVNCPFFKSIQLSLGLKLPLDTYLLKPVQRISKYQLLLKELKKVCSLDDRDFVDESIESMLDVVNNLNDVMHASFIVGFNLDMKSNGRLLKRDQLLMTKVKRNLNNKTSSAAMNVVNRFQMNSKTVEIFLFEKAILICKRKTDDLPHNQQSPVQISLVNNTSVNSTFSQTSLNNTISSNSSSLMSSSSSTFSSTASSNSVFNFQYFYQFKEAIKTNEIGLTENLKNDKKKFEIWTDSFSYIFEASSENEKQLWINQVKILLENQLNEIKSKYQTIKLESLSKLVNNNNIIPANLGKTQSFKINTSSLSTPVSMRSTSTSSSSNRTNSCDYDFDPEADADTDFTNEFSNFVSRKNNDKTNVQHIFLPKSSDKLVTDELTNKSNPNTSISSITFSSKAKSNSLLSIEHGK
ncbi:unnamed protein product [Brachionus calyciflorus]|uniref:Uncharacterized protein n=1 Tax=Brachionus calyciflorus TaxID=104777 RepID=A0A813P9W3_9BILA|nr:unnamed protein product [Brachionus calyciflorus]